MAISLLDGMDEVENTQEQLEQLSIHRPHRHAGSEKKCQLWQDRKIDYANIIQVA